MRVVGTAGHVDHGKTALIRSLTGMDADRLPEEKARGMTTDLGFAWYDDGPRGTIGVVDVPGHERYLRNMVAGAWGLDLVILTVAADDGWMPQTELHAAIAAALAAPAVVIAVTKADAVPAERVALVRADAEERAAALFGRRPDSVAVSNLTGDGVAELKAAIGRALDERPARASSGAGAALFVDRVFSPRGGGIVAAGTLTGGAVAVGDELSLLPRGERVRVRGLHCYGLARERAEPGSRAAFSLAGLKDAPTRGDLLAAPGGAILSGDDILVRLLPLPGSGERFRLDGKGRSRVRGGLRVELAVGTARRDAELWPLPGGRYARLVLGESVACPLGSPVAALAMGGAALLCRGVALRASPRAPQRASQRAGRGAAPERRALAAALPRVEALALALESPGGAGYAGRLVAEVAAAALEACLSGRVTLPPGSPLASLPPAALEAAGLAVLSGGEARGDAPITWLFDSIRLGEADKAIRAGAAEPGGLSKAGAVSILGGDEAAATAVLARYEARGELTRDGGAWRPRGEARRLSPEEAAVEGRLKAAGKAGLEPGKTAPQAEARVLKALCSFGLAMPLDGGIFLARDAYDGCVAAILAGRAAGDRFSVPEAKERAGLSRKYILPLLNRMEDKGFVKRSGDERVVVKAFP